MVGYSKMPVNVEYPLVIQHSYGTWSIYRCLMMSYLFKNCLFNSYVKLAEATCRETPMMQI